MEGGGGVPKKVGRFACGGMWGVGGGVKYPPPRHGDLPKVPGATGLGLDMNISAARRISSKPPGTKFCLLPRVCAYKTTQTVNHFAAHFALVQAYDGSEMCDDICVSSSPTLPVPAPVPILILVVIPAIHGTFCQVSLIAQRPFDGFCGITGLCLIDAFSLVEDS